MKIFLAGNWVEKPKKIEVTNPFDNSVIDTVPRADAQDLEKALAYAERGAKVMAKLSSYERWKILRKAADMMAARNEELGQLISKEEGKIIAEGRGEANRAVETIMGSAEEAKRLYGETVPLDADPTGAKKFGFTLRIPCGVVAAIAPFNFPLNLVAHKVGPGTGCRQFRYHKAGFGYAVVGAEADGDFTRSRSACRRHPMPYRLGGRDR